MLTDIVWLGPLVWACLYVSDYFLTITSARSYQAQDTIVFEGSYEITPMFQADVNALRRISPRFIVVLILSTAYVAWLSNQSATGRFRELYEFMLGALVLIEFAVHIRHFRNWYLFRHVGGPSGVRGHLEYPRGLVLRASALEILSFAILYASLFAATGSLFVLGGAAACATLSVNHDRLARRHEAQLPPA